MLLFLLALAEPASPSSCNYAEASGQDSLYCSEDSLKLATARLEIAYQNARRRARLVNPRPAGVTPNQTLEKAVIQSQLKWLAFKAAQCTMEQFEGSAGSMAGSFELACQTRLIEERSKSLDEFASQIGK